MKKIIIVVVLSIAVTGNGRATPTLYSFRGQIDSTITDTTYQVIAAAEGTFSYEVLIGKKVFIRQQNIPGRPGNKGFGSKADAQKVAGAVIKKMQQGIIPPTITTAELGPCQIFTLNFLL